ncbi:hypothetical protein MY11210_002886 [Beauveria gryllotalpidicola]
MNRSLRPSAAQPSCSNNPRTPEPSTVADPAASIPPPLQSPAKPRFRLRKRTASNLSAPTKQFLASVAAADVPIPSIEEPSVLDEDMIDSVYPSFSFHTEPIDYYHSARQAFSGRALSPPKTPALGVVPLLEPHQFPDWTLDSTLSSLESSPDYESSRPSTARSTQTSSSLFSRYSLASEELSQCVSPESEYTDCFGSFLSADDAHRATKPRASIKSRKAPWTRSMSQHLWTTYMMYLQDPKVTPFRIGKSGIPPHGVCLRVAREAKRSWRRSWPSAQARSRNTTPTADALRPVSHWPHTCAATRGHLRELCKTSTGSAARNHRYNANSPTPFGKTASRYRNRRSAPPNQQQQHSVFSGSELAMSLSMSTSESMQPDGPLARLAALQYDEPSAAAVPPSLDTEPAPLQERPPLGAPFVIKSCGPSVATLEDPFGLSEAPVRQNQTAGARNRLGSPAQLVQSRPNSQKRRQAMLEPRRRKRPSLGTDFWTDPSSNSHSSLQDSHSFAEFCSTPARDRDGLLVPRTNIQKLFEAAPATHAALGGPVTAQPTLRDGPARLGSPFVMASTSQSFPNRFSSPGRIEMSALRRPYATVQQGGAAESSGNNASLANRLAYIDERLRSINRPEEERRRSQSPQ